jgi:putative transposase
MLTSDLCSPTFNVQRSVLPEIFNTDQGSQFTSDDFTRALKDHHIKISMDGKGRWIDNVFIERLWRSVKYQDIYLKAYESIRELKEGPTKWFDRYDRRRHQGLDNRTPNEVYWSTLPGARHAV